MMPSEFEQNLDKYAEVVVRVALNLQAGQRLLISASIEHAPLVRLIAVKAYQMGARLVDVMWMDEQLQLIRFLHAPRDSFEEFPTWRADAALEIAKAGDADLAIASRTPNLLSGQDPELVAIVRRTSAKYFRTLMDLQGKNATTWAVITAPSDGWADMVFPDLPPETRKDRLWETLFQICRINQSDPVSMWQEHIGRIVARREYLCHRQYAALKLTAPGTDLLVGLPKRHVWKGGHETTQSGIDYTPNIPTEEICTMPQRNQTEGVVTATRPVSYGGILIEDFALTFCEGQVVKATARKGEESLHKLLETDQGARYLGEVALVPHSSPISQSGLVFYNTIIDENAGSHIALGEAFRFFMEGAETLSDDAFATAGGNLSLIHVDFTIGSGEMDVDGITVDGTVEPVMRSGEWTFEV